MYNVHLFIINGKQYSINIAKPYNITSSNNDNISEKIIGLTIIAMGTSLPELVTAIVAVIKGDEDLAVGNLVGYCITAEIVNIAFIFFLL